MHGHTPSLCDIDVYKNNEMCLLKKNCYKLIIAINKIAIINLNIMKI